MALKARIKALTDVPEALREFYAEKDGEFALGIEGMVPKVKVDEFRDSNLELKRQIEELNTKFGNVDPDKYRELVEKDQSVREKKLIDAGKVEELLAERTGAMKAEHEKQVKTLTDGASRLTKQLEGLVIDNAIRAEASEAGVKPTAVEDMLLRGRSLFRLVDGKAVPMDGDKPVFGKSGDPMDIKEWVGSLTERAPHLFEPSNGGGAPKDGGKGGAGAGRISRDDPAAFLANIDNIAGGKTQVV